MSGPEEGPTDGEVVRRCLRGDREVYALLVRRYQDVIFRHARGMLGSDDDAADVAQQTFIRGYHKLSSCREPDRVGGWLFRICANICRDQLKDPRRRGRSLDDAAPVEEAAKDPEEQLEVTQLGDAIEDALSTLPGEQREAFLMKHVEGRSYEEMSELLDASVPALKMRVHRAREGLAELLEAYR